MSLQERKYHEYIQEHIANVQRVWKELEKYQTGQFWIEQCYMYVIDRLIRDHDESKLTAMEFESYRRHFYPMDDETPEAASFDYAWNHHQKCNPHHWEYWVLVEDAGVKILDMPFIYVIEMLCDWGGMSIKFGDVPSEFYAKKKIKMQITEKTARLIERWIPLIDAAVEDSRKAVGEK